MAPFHLIVAKELGISPSQAAACEALLSEGATVPFIARYRKEATGGLDEVQAAAVKDRLKALSDLSERRESILRSLAERGLLAPELEDRLRAASAMAELEDIYLPFRPKRRTRAAAAREKGLAPLAEALMAQDPSSSPALLAEKAISEGAAAETPEEALSGARDILAEEMAEDKRAREAMRELYALKAVVRSKVRAGKEEAAQKYLDYLDYEEPLASMPSHRYLAMRRGEAEELLSLSVQPEAADAEGLMRRLFVRNQSPAGLEVEAAAMDSLRRLLGPSIELETRLAAKKRADREAIKIFSSNLRELLLAAPLGARPVLAIDPGFRTGCKMAALAADGALIAYDTVNPHAGGQGQRAEAARKVREMAGKHSIAAIAVGNGTAGRETLSFVKEIEDLPKELIVASVNESGASIYSASEAAREEFPDLDLTIRGAVSIGRRLIDPLAELVKIDPKSIGVGQYQHDVDQGLLKEGLDEVVVSCVSSVGVEANTASERLLSYVAGLGPSLAKNIVEHRRANGPFKSRQELLKVKRLGPKAFEQCAGFLRLSAGDNPLDRSAVHPESYHVVEAMAADLGVGVPDLLRDKALRAKIRLADYQTDKVGLPTLTDIMAELDKPGRDPRREFKAPAFQKGLDSLSDLSPGMRLPGVVTNVTAFGAFVDVGVHQDGLAHVSQLADRFVRDPSEVVRPGQEVLATVLSVDIPRGRLSLSLKSNPDLDGARGGAKSDAGASGAGHRQRGGRGDSRRGPQGGDKARQEGGAPFNSAFDRLSKLI